MKFLYLLPALLIGSVVAWADDAEDLTTKPGYVDFSELAADYGEPRVMVDIGESLIQLVSAFKHDDPVAEAALRDIESVRVHAYDTAGDIAAATQHMQQVSKLLGDLDWSQIVRVRDDDERVDVYVKHGEEQIHGLTVMKVDDDEAVFVNVLGAIDPSELSRLMEQVDVDVDVDL